MFIYKFMAGIFDTLGNVDEDWYDPHHHRKIEKPTSYSETMTHLLKASIGAGILAMPDAFRRMGVIIGLAGLFAIGVFATYCIHILIAAQYEICKREQKGYMTYPKSIRVALKMGPPCLRSMSKCVPCMIDGLLILWQLGLCSVFIVFIAENIKQVCDFYDVEIAIRKHICILLIPLLILNMVKDLKLLSPLSTISNILTLLGFILVFFYLIEDDLTLEHEKFEPKELKDIPVFIGITLFALEAVGVVLALEYNMENPKRFVGLTGLFNIGMAIILSFYALVGVFGYMKYGDEVKASITLNLPQEQKKAQAAKVILAVAITLTFPLQNFVAYAAIWRKLKKKYVGVKQTCVDYSLRIILVIIPFVAAVAVPQLGPFISFIGALCLTLLAVVGPALLDLCIWYPDKYGPLHYKWFRDWLFILMGIFCLFSGVYTSVLEIYENTED